MWILNMCLFYSARLGSGFGGGGKNSNKQLILKILPNGFSTGALIIIYSTQQWIHIYIHKLGYHDVLV